MDAALAAFMKGLVAEEPPEEQEEEIEGLDAALRLLARQWDSQLPAMEHAQGKHDQRAHGRGGTVAFLARAIETDGGFTYDVAHSPKMPHGGFALSTRQDAEKVIPANLSRDQMREEIRSYAKRWDTELRDPRVFVGGWHDTQTGKVYLDLSTVVKSKREALDLARSAKQVAIFDLDRGESVYLEKKAA